jgi:hypothetical protein
MPQGVAHLTTGPYQDQLMLMKGQTAPSVRTIETSEDFDETRLEAVGYVFHGKIPAADGKRGSVRAGTNLLHFARCGKLDKVVESESKIWFRTLAIAKQHLDTTIGHDRWKWCKTCEREITQRIINEQ